jgi:hypothetical protein
MIWFVLFYVIANCFVESYAISYSIDVISSLLLIFISLIEIEIKKEKQMNDYQSALFLWNNGFNNIANQRSLYALSYHNRDCFTSQYKEWISDLTSLCGYFKFLFIIWYISPSARCRVRMISIGQMIRNFFFLSVSSICHTLGFFPDHYSICKRVFWPFSIRYFCNWICSR